MDHLMDILVAMGHLVMEDILQDVDHQEVDHKEEDHLVPLAHLEIWDPLDKEDHQENTRSQTKDRRKYATQAAVTSYEKVVVDAIASSSESEDPDEDVHHISNDEVSDDNEEHLSD